MTKISYYKADQQHFISTICQLTEKCYYSNERSCIAVENNNFKQELDRVLWTYSRKHFIPHGVDEDPAPDRQPVLITSRAAPSATDLGFQNYLLIEPGKNKIAEFLSNDLILKQTKKILIISTIKIITNIQEIDTLVSPQSKTNFSVEYFEQNTGGKWQSVK